MKTIINVCLLFLISGETCFAQYNYEWARWYNSSVDSWDVVYSSITDSAGNTYLAGSIYSQSSDFDIRIIKYSNSGSRLWEATYNGPSNSLDRPSDMTVDKAGNVYVTGKTLNGASHFDIITLKFNANGMQEWIDLYNGAGDSTDMGTSIATDVFGNVFVCGGTRKSVNYNPDCITIKYNSSGIRQWVKFYEFQLNSDDSGLFVRTDNIGNCYVGVQHYSSLAGLIKYNSSGTLQWSRSVGNSNSFPFFFDMKVDVNGNVYMNVDLDSLKLVKYSSAGVQQWIKRTPFAETVDYISSQANEVYKFRTLDLDSAGNALLLYSAYPYYSNNYRNFVVSKFNQNGTVLWSSIQTLPPPMLYNGFSIPISIDVDAYGNSIILSVIDYLSTGIDLHTTKLNSSGIRQWSARYYNFDFPFSDDIACGIGTDYPGNVYAVGYGVQLASEYDFLTIKYPSSIQLNAKLIIEGMYDSTNNTLRKRDTVVAYLRNIASPYQRIDSAKAVVDTSDFKTGFCFVNAEQGNYYIEIHHRNSIETWSKSGGELMSKKFPLYYDFTVSGNQAYGQNMALRNGKYCIFSGDVNQSGFIDGTDLSLIDNDAFAFASGYLSSDVTGDGFVDATDYSISDNNAFRFIGVVRP